MDEYINRQSTYEKLRQMQDEPQFQHHGEDFYAGICAAMDVIAEEPAADVALVRHGRWLDIRERWQGGSTWKECSECGISLCGEPPYCRCGAKMDL